MADTKKSRYSKYNRTRAHVNSQRLWQYAQSLHVSLPDGTQVLKEEVDTRPYPYSRSYLQLLTIYKWKFCLYFGFQFFVFVIFLYLRTSNCVYMFLMVFLSFFLFIYLFCHIIVCFSLFYNYFKFFLKTTLSHLTHQFQFPLTPLFLLPPHSFHPTNSLLRRNRDWI